MIKSIKSVLFLFQGTNLEQIKVKFGLSKPYPKSVKFGLEFFGPNQIINEPNSNSSEITFGTNLGPSSYEKLTIVLYLATKLVSPNIGKYSLFHLSSSASPKPSRSCSMPVSQLSALTINKERPRWPF